MQLGEGGMRESKVCRVGAKGTPELWQLSTGALAGDAPRERPQILGFLQPLTSHHPSSNYP